MKLPTPIAPNIDRPSLSLYPGLQTTATEQFISAMQYSNINIDFCLLLYQYQYWISRSNIHRNITFEKRTVWNLENLS